MPYDDIYNAFYLIVDKDFFQQDSDLAYEYMRQWLHNAISIPYIGELFSEISLNDEIEEITGILNGTTNYMMTKMYDENADYDAVLKEAQAMGYAERDPSADVEGHDACRKIAILSSIISGKLVDFEDIYTEGITKITTTDIQYAKAMGMKIKLLASCKRFTIN